MTKPLRTPANAGVWVPVSPDVSRDGVPQARSGRLDAWSAEVSRMTRTASFIGADLIGVPGGWGRGGWVLWLGEFGRGVSFFSYVAFFCGKVGSDGGQSVEASAACGG
jgi:hypothetical protein